MAPTKKPVRPWWWQWLNPMKALREYCIYECYAAAMHHIEKAEEMGLNPTPRGTALAILDRVKP